MPAPTPSVVSICNLALSRIGNDSLIESIDDANPRARACKALYEECRRQVLEAFPWNFARSVVALAQLTSDPPPGWGYAYRYPNDCLTARALTSEAGDRTSLASPFLRWDEWTNTLYGRMPYAVMNDQGTAGARLICTDLDEAYLWYTADVDQPQQMSALFRSALSWKLAGELAGSLRADARLRSAAIGEFANALSEAAALSMAETQPDPAPDSPSVQARL